MHFKFKIKKTCYIHNSIMFKFMIVIFMNIYKDNRFVFQPKKIDKSLKFYEKN